MKYVLDSSVAFKWLIPEKDPDKALRLLDDYQNDLLELIAPDVLPAEVTHALTRAQRQGRVSPASGNQLFSDLLNQLPPLSPYLAYLPRAYAISSSTRQGVYDCINVAFAEQEQCDLITADDKLIKNLQPVFPFIVALSSLLDLDSRCIARYCSIGSTAIDWLAPFISRLENCQFAPQAGRAWRQPFDTPKPPLLATQADAKRAALADLSPHSVSAFESSSFAAPLESGNGRNCAYARSNRLRR